MKKTLDYRPVKMKKTKARLKKISLKAILISILLLQILHLPIRLINLTTNQPLFGDEAIYIRWAQIIHENPKEWLFVPHTDGKQPFFMWTNAFLTLPLFNDPVFSGRLVSVIASSLTLLAIFLISLYLFSFSCAIFASLFYTFSPYHFLYSRMAFVDTLLGTFAILTMLFTLLLMQKKHIIWAIGIGICIGCAFLTKSPGMFLFVPVFLSLFIFKQQRSISAWAYLFFAFIIAGSLISINFFSPQKPIITEAGTILHHKSFFIFSQISQPLEILKIWAKNLSFLPGYIHFSFPYFFIPALLFAIYRIFRPVSYKNIFLSVFSLLPIIVITVIGTHPFCTYYLFAFLPIFILIGDLISSFKWGWTKWVISLFLIIPTLHFNLPLVFSFLDAPLPKGQKEIQEPEGYNGIGSREALEFLKENVKDNVVLLLPVDWGCPADLIFMYLKDDPKFTIYEVWWWPNKIPHLIPNVRSIEMAVSKYQQKKTGLLYPEKLKDKEVWFVTTSSYTGQSYVLAQNPEFSLIKSFSTVDIYKKPKGK